MAVVRVAASVEPFQLEVGTFAVASYRPFLVALRIRLLCLFEAVLEDAGAARPWDWLRCTLAQAAGYVEPDMEGRSTSKRRLLGYLQQARRPTSCWGNSSC